MFPEDGIGLFHSQSSTPQNKLPINYLQRWRSLYLPNTGGLSEDRPVFPVFSTTHSLLLLILPFLYHSILLRLPVPFELLGSYSPPPSPFLPFIKYTSYTPYRLPLSPYRVACVVSRPYPHCILLRPTDRVSFRRILPSDSGGG